MRVVGYIFVLLFSINSTISTAQVRNGWRSIYDKEGRLTRMNYFQDGKVVQDSNLFFQYYNENLLKGIVSGEIKSGVGCVNGTVKLFGLAGDIEAYHIKRNDELVFDLDCDYEGNCSAVWADDFTGNSGFWKGDDVEFQNGNIIIENKGSVGYAVYSPEITTDLSNSFVCKIVIPLEENNARQGIAFGWKDENNYYLFEIIYGKYYSIQYYKNGESIAVTEGRKEIEKQKSDVVELVISKNNTNIIFEINGSIEVVLPTPDCRCNNLALVTRARGKARYDSFIFKYQLKNDDLFFRQNWVGTGSGFFISGTGKILTTYEAIREAKNIRVLGIIDGERYTLPASIVRTDEENNVAVLQIIDDRFNKFETLPYGYTDRIPNVDSKVYSIGYPSSVSGIFMSPDIFEGKILPGQASYAEYRLLEMPFRYGMNGAPVFDTDANLIGVCAYKGMDLMFTEIIDFYYKSRMFKANLGKIERRIESPFKNESYQQKIKSLSETVVIVETSMFLFPED